MGFLDQSAWEAEKAKLLAQKAKAAAFPAAPAPSQIEEVLLTKPPSPSTPVSNVLKPSPFVAPTKPKPQPAVPGLPPPAAKVKPPVAPTAPVAPVAPTPAPAPPAAPAAPPSPADTKTGMQFQKIAATKSAPMGFSGDKWSDLLHQTPKYITGRILGGGGTIHDVAAALGAQVMGEDIIHWRNPEDGRTYEIDVWHNVGSASQSPRWGINGYIGPDGKLILSDGAGNPRTADEDGDASGAPGAPSAPGGGGTSPGMQSAPGAGGLQVPGLPSFEQWSSSVNSNAWSQDPRSTELWNMLMKRATQDRNINRNDPIIASQSNAFSAQQQRAGRDYLAEQAERQGPFGNLGQERRMVSEGIGQATGTFEAELMGRELTSRRQEIQAALDGAQGLLTEEQRLALTRELALFDHALQRANLQQRAYEFDTSDEFRRSPLAS